MERQSPNKFGEATLLAYVEQTMSAAQLAEFEAAIAGDPRLLASLRRMQADCEHLRSIPDEQPPATLVADVLAGLERSMLIESDLMAPPIDMRRYRASHWQRYAAAAGFALLLVGGGFMLLRTLRFQSSDDILAPTPLVHQDAPQAPAKGIEPVESRSLEPAAQDTHAQASQSHDTASVAATEPHGVSAAFEAALSAPVDPAVVAAIARDWPADLDLRANVVAADSSVAFETIAQRLRSRGGDLIINATVNLPAPTPKEARGPDQIGGMGPSVHASPSDPVSMPMVVNANPAVINPDDRVPLVDQSRYAAEGYQFTLLGTPSDILGVLRELGADRTLRVSWARQGAGGMLVDLVAPNLPPQTRWDRVMFWWVDPAARFDEARAAVAHASTEPFIRIPVRIQRAGSR